MPRLKFDLTQPKAICRRVSLRCFLELDLLASPVDLRDYVAPAERGENPQLAKTNKKGSTRRPCLLVAGVGFHGFAVVSAAARLRLNKLHIQPSPQPNKKPRTRRGLFVWLRE